MADQPDLELAAAPAGPRPRRRLPLPALAALLARHPATVQAFTGRVWTAAGPSGHWYWLGAISDSGHGKVQLGSRRDGTAVVALAHRIAWILGGGDCSVDAVIRHDCDESSCQNFRCLRAGTMADNSGDWVSRRHRVDGPLGDIRGLAGRARAIRAAILAADTPADQLAAARPAAAAGWRLRGQDTLLAVTPAPAPSILDGWVPVWTPPPPIGDTQPRLW